jgi:hypothetical protein
LFLNRQDAEGAKKDLPTAKAQRRKENHLPKKSLRLCAFAVPFRVFPRLGGST